MGEALFLIRIGLPVDLKMNDFRPLPSLSKPTRFVSMRKLTATFFLTLAVLLGSVGMSSSGDFQKNAIALTDLIQRSGLFYKLLSPTPYNSNVW